MWRARLSQNFSEIRLLIHPRSEASAGARAFMQENLSEFMALNQGLDLKVVEAQEQKARLLMQDHIPHVHAFCLEGDSVQLIEQKMQFVTEFAERKRLLMEQEDEVLQRENPKRYQELVDERNENAMRNGLKQWHMETARLLDLYGPRQVRHPGKLMSEMDIGPNWDFAEWKKRQDANKRRGSARSVA